MEMERVRAKLRKEKDSLLKKYQAHAVGIGYKYVHGKRTNEVSIVFFVHRKRPKKQLKKLGIPIIPSELFGLKCDVREIRRGFTTRSEKKKHRPFSGGVSGISIKEKGAAGTLGIVNKKGEVLSCNHVLANESLTTNPTAEKGDPFIQPSWLDNGSEDDVVGELDRWVDLVPLGVGTCPIGNSVVKTLNFLAQLLRRKGRFHYYVEEDNYVDGAVGVAYEGTWKAGVMGMSEIVEARDPELGEEVQKRGRTTGLTKGVVTAVNVTVNVGGYQGIYTCRFVDQIAIEGEESFSAPGDSGSSILTLNKPLMFVGLLFAGGKDSSGKDITIATPYRYIKEYLDFTV